MQRLHLIDVSLSSARDQEANALAIRLHDLRSEPVGVSMVMCEALIVAIGVLHSHDWSITESHWLSIAL